MRAAVVGECLEPAGGLFEEVEGGHEVAGEADVEGGEDAVDESHVVEDGEPCDHDAFGRVLPAEVYIFDGVDEVAVGDHDPFGGAGGARGVLQEGEGVAGNVGVLPEVGHFEGKGIGDDPVEVVEDGGCF